jgi:hypothetical protein
VPKSDGDRLIGTDNEQRSVALGKKMLTGVPMANGGVDRGRTAEEAGDWPMSWTWTSQSWVAMQWRWTITRPGCAMSRNIATPCLAKDCAVSI